MRKLTFTILLLTISLSHSQIKVDSTDYRYYYQKVFEVEGKKEVLRENANAWIVKNYRNTNEGIKMNTGENLIAKGVFKGYVKGGLGNKIICNIHYTSEISFKDNRYRLTFNNIHATYTGEDPGVTYFANYSLIPIINDFESFSRIHADLAERQMGIGKKMTIKIINNPNKFDKNLKRHKKHHDEMFAQIEDQFTSLSKSLHDYMRSKKKDDW